MPSPLQRPFPIPSAIFARGLGILWLSFGALLSAADAPLLRVAFESQTVMISGRVDTEATAEAIVKALRNARPDLTADRSALAIDPSVSLPDLSEFPSLLAELGLSTHEGRLELWPDRLVIGGLTDSLVTHSALRIRAKPLLEGRALHNRLCIVSTEDLPKLEVSLAGANLGMLEVAPPVVVVAAPIGSFEMPGLSFAKLLAVIRLPGQIDRLSGKSAAPRGTDAGHRRAPRRASWNDCPVQQRGRSPGRHDAPHREPGANLRNPALGAFFPEFFPPPGQSTGTDRGTVETPPLPRAAWAPVRIEAVKASGGSAAFNEYLCERRAAEVARFLTEGEVAPLS